MDQKLIITSLAGEIIIAVFAGELLLEIHREKVEEESLIGNIYLSRIEKVLPGVGAVFVDLGLPDRQGYLSEDEYTSRLDRPWSELKKNQTLMVQVIKDPGKHKALALSNKFNLPGRWVVLLPTGDKVVLSHKITNDDLKQKLLEWGKKHLPENMGLIIRTSAQEATEQEIKQEVDYLARLWQLIKISARDLTPPSLVYQEQDIMQKIFRDLIRTETKEILVDDAELYRKLSCLLQLRQIGHKVKITRWFGDTPLYAAMMIPQQLNAALQKKVWLRSGGYLIIEENEALTTIDVNTGKNTGNRNLAETLFEVNLEAVNEIARQIRLRNIGGIIIVDFGGIPALKEQEKICEALHRATKNDPKSVKIHGFTSLGLLEMTRKKEHPSLSRVWLEECSFCKGAGKVKSIVNTAFEIEALLCEKAGKIEAAALGFSVHPEVAAILTGNNGAGLARIEKETGKTIFIIGDEHLAPHEIKLSARFPLMRKSICI